MRSTSYQHDSALRCAADAFAEAILPPANVFSPAETRQFIFFECSEIPRTLPAPPIFRASSRMLAAYLQHYQ